MTNIPSSGITSTEAGKAAFVDASDSLPRIADAAPVFRGDCARTGPDFLIQHGGHGTLKILNCYTQDRLQDLETVEGAVLRRATGGRPVGAIGDGEDRPDLSGLKEANFSSRAVGDYVKVEQEGADAFVSVKGGGSGGASEFQYVIVPQSVDARGIVDLSLQMTVLRHRTQLFFELASAAGLAPLSTLSDIR